MFLYFILLKKVIWMFEKKCVFLYIYVLNIVRYVIFFSYLICLLKYGKNIFELILIGFKFKIFFKNVYVFEEKKVIRNKNFSKLTLIRVRERKVCESFIGNIIWCFLS